MIADIATLPASSSQLWLKHRYIPYSIPLLEKASRVRTELWINQIFELSSIVDTPTTYIPLFQSSQQLVQ